MISDWSHRESGAGSQPAIPTEVPLSRGREDCQIVDAIVSETSEIEHGTVSGEDGLPYQPASGEGDYVQYSLKHIMREKPSP